MKKLHLLLTFTIFLFISSFAQEHARFSLTGTNAGTGTFTNAVLSGFTWTATGALSGSVQIKDNEIFDDGNEFETVFGQANNAGNLRIQIYPNGAGTTGKPILSKAKLTLNFDQTTPSEGWGFCLVDIDVENCLISAIDENDKDVSVELIDSWLIQLFDANLVEDSINLPKWDSAHAALLGSDTPDDYVVYDSLVIGGMPSSEAPAAFFQPNIPLKSLSINFENLQQTHYTSYHFYLAAQTTTSVLRNENSSFYIFPNPVVNKFKISGLPAGQAGPVIKVGGSTIALYDLNGRKLLEKQILKGSEEISVDVSGLNSGIYFCKVSGDKYSATKKLIIQK